MKKFLRAETISLGLAIFSMFFGAGNVIFPLAVGQFAGDKNFYAISGLILTAAVMPIAGVIAMILFEGNYKEFFGRLGGKSGFVLALIIISLLGPLGSTPRCIALSYTTLNSALGNISPLVFSAASCLIIFWFTYRKNQMLKLLGMILTPILLFSLIAIILFGFFTESNPQTNESTPVNIFMKGLIEGYNTMDLLAAFFFSSTVINILKKENIERCHLTLALQGSLIAGFLLALIYIGFSYLAALHGSDISVTGKEELLAAITMKLTKGYGGILVCIAVAMACLTTAIALVSAFTDFVQKEVLNEKVPHDRILIFTLLLTFFISIYEFKGISTFLGPILEISYPGLIVLTFLNIASKTYGVKTLKFPVMITFLLSGLFYGQRIY